MIGAVITFLIYVCILALVVYLILWVLRDIVGVPIPEKVVQILWVVVALVCIGWLANLMIGGGGTFHLPRIN